MPPRLHQLQIKNLRSVGSDTVTIDFPEKGPLVLLGENNAGKSNITRALDIVFGELWPGSRQLEEHDFHGRDSDGVDVTIAAKVSGIRCPGGPHEINWFTWKHDRQDLDRSGDPVQYRFRCANSKFCTNTYPSRKIRSALSATVLDADRRLDYQLSYASKYTMLSKLMHRFHEKLLSDASRRENLTKAFTQILDQFEDVPEFADFKRLLADAASDLGQNLPYRLDIDFSAYDPSNFFRSLRVHPSFEGEVRNFDELGTGQTQILALSFAYAYAAAYGDSDGTILVIDEPESNLHPLAQRWLADRLNHLSSASGLQVVVTTHSPHFVDLARPENLVLVSKDNDEVTRVVQRTRDDLHNYLVQRGANPERTRPSTIGSFYAASATIEIVSGLFSRRCVLVEGPTESLALPELLKLIGVDVLREGIAIVSVEGVGNIAKWHRLYTVLGVNCYCVFDTDADAKPNDAKDLTKKRRDIMSALAYDAERGNPDRQSTDHLHVEDTHATMAPDFEGAATGLFGDRWTELRDEAVAFVGESKPLRARYAAQRLTRDDLSPTAIGALEALAAAIKGSPISDDTARQRQTSSM